ncbi:MAG: GNAT family N-acetyltransferase [Candidatus Omnitrophica bacterium]|nr:GNAT family N-acetyltransferase [Candidatus Omnitrophota bacterium]
MTKVELIQASRIDYQAYATFQREAYRDHLARTGATDSHMTPEFYRWKYHTPAGEGRIAVVKEGDTIISSSAMAPFRIHANNSTLIGWHCLDVATLPQARKKGLFFSTLEALKESVGSDEIFFAFPNSNSIQSFLKLDCQENVILTTWIAPFVNLSKRLFNEIKETKEFGPKHDIFIKEFLPDGPILERSSGYLNWRYASHPNNKYVFFSYEQKDHCLGFAVARKAHVMGRDLVLVMELWGRRHCVEVSLLKHIAAWTINEGKKMMAMMSTTIPLFFAIQACFFPVPSFLLPKRQILVLDIKSHEQEKLMKKRWMIQTGDWDVF